MESPVQFRHPADLTVHPAIKGLPELADDDPNFVALCRDVQMAGWLAGVAALIDGQDRILDGRHRWRAAKRLQIDLPCCRWNGDAPASDAQAIAVALKTLANRRHYSAPQIALLAWPGLKAQFAEARKHQKDGLLRGKAPVSAGADTGKTLGIPQKGCTESAPKTIAELCAEIGVSQDTFARAEAVWSWWEGPFSHTEFEWSEAECVEAGLAPGGRYTFRQIFEPQLLRREKPIGLGAACAAMGFKADQPRKAALGHPHTGNRPKDAERQLELFTATLRDAKTRWEYWEKMDEEARQAHWTAAKALAAQTEQLKARSMAAYYLKLYRIYDARAKGDGE